MKIKKYFLSFLIIISLFGVFAPLAKAANGENCFPLHEASTKADCESLGGTWTADSTATCAAGSDISHVICKIQGILNSIIPVLIALGLVYFVWGVVQYVIGDEDEAKKKGRDRIIYGIIGLTAIICVWALVNVVSNTLGLGGQSTPPITSLTSFDKSTENCPLGQHPTFRVLSTFIICNINTAVVPLIFSFAVLMFIWGVVQFVINADDSEKKEKGRQFMLWGIIALTVMISVWGLVNILENTFGLTGGFFPKVSP